MEPEVWSLFVQYPNREPVCWDGEPPQSLSELREMLQVWPDQQLLISDPSTPEVRFERVEQLFDGARLRVLVPRRRIFVSLGTTVRERPIVWYPNATVEQIELAIVKACGLPLGTPIEVFEGEDAVVLSPSIPNDTSVTVVPLRELSSTNGSLATARPLTAESARTTPAPPAPVSRSSRQPSPPMSRGAGVRQVSRGRAGLSSSLPAPGMRQESRGGLSSSLQSTGSVRRASSRAGSPMQSLRDQPATAVMVAASAPPGRVAAQDEHCIRILAGHTGWVLSVFAVGDVLFTGSQDWSIMIWDLGDLQYIGTLPGHRGPVKSLAAVLEQKLLFSGSGDKTIKVWSLERFVATKTLFGHTGEVNALRILQSNGILLSGGEDKCIKAWDIHSLSLIINVDQAHGSSIFALAELDAGMFATASRDKTVKVWLTATWQSRKALTPPHYDGVTQLAVGRHRGKFYSCSRDKSIRRWDCRGFESDLQLPQAHTDWITCLALSSSEQVLFSGGKDGVIKVWDQELRCKDHLTGHGSQITALTHVDGYLFSASHDRTVRVWKVDQYEPQ